MANAGPHPGHPERNFDLPFGHFRLPGFDRDAYRNALHERVEYRRVPGQFVELLEVLRIGFDLELHADVGVAPRHIFGETEEAPQIDVAFELGLHLLEVDAAYRRVRHQAGGYAGGSAEARTAVVGDVFILAVKNEPAEALRHVPGDWTLNSVTFDHQVGSFIHELGHMHPELGHDDSGIMAAPANYENVTGGWWKFPWVGFPGQSKFQVWINAWRWKLNL